MSIRSAKDKMVRPDETASKGPSTVDDLLGPDGNPTLLHRLVVDGTVSLDEALERRRAYLATLDS